MILYAEHSFNASTFTARVITSTLSDLYSAVVGAIGALKGPLHGGANEAVMHIFDEIGSASEVSGMARHRACREAQDHGLRPQSVQARRLAGSDDEGGARFAAGSTMTALTWRNCIGMLEGEFVSRKGIYPNLDYPSGPAYNLIGYDTLTFLMLPSSLRGSPGGPRTSSNNRLPTRLSARCRRTADRMSGTSRSTSRTLRRLTCRSCRRRRRVYRRRDPMTEADEAVLCLHRPNSGRPGRPGGMLSGVHPVDLHERAWRTACSSATGSSPLRSTMYCSVA